MPMAKITPVGEAGLYHVHFLDGRTDPGFGHGGGEHPSHGLPGGPGHVSPPIFHPGHPDHGLPSSPGHPDQGLPGRPPHVGGRPPGSGGGGIPDNSLPSTPPPTLMPGWTLALVRSPDGKWHYASLAPSSPPPKPLPEPIPPGGAPDQGLPPQPPGGVAGTPLPPTAAPKPA
jgi:collagen type IV alpha